MVVEIDLVVVVVVVIDEIDLVVVVDDEGVDEVRREISEKALK